MQPAFTKNAVNRYAEVMVRRTSAALERWSKLDEIDVVLESRRLALEIAAESLFGNDVSRQRPTRSATPSRTLASNCRPASAASRCSSPTGSRRLAIGA
jgi:cytochrome P450